jgi:5-dehydro-2-deoxygluconokinase
VQGWEQLSQVIARHDPYCRGVLLLGLEASEEELWQGFRASAGQALCKGFAVGRTLFADAATAWFADELDDAGVVAEVAARYQRLVRMWQAVRRGEATLAPSLEDHSRGFVPR